MKFSGRTSSRTPGRPRLTSTSAATTTSGLPKRRASSPTGSSRLAQSSDLCLAAIVKRQGEPFFDSALFVRDQSIDDKY